MNSVDLAFASALDQAQLIRSKQISPTELTQLYLDRIQQLNPSLGSYFTVTADQALADANAKTERLTTVSDLTELPPFWGVPIAIKDLNAVEGVRCTYGSRALMDNIAIHDDAVVAKIKQAGFIILGKTAASEVGSLPYTEPDGFPPARNPWNLDYTPGGSSGGSASAVAAGLSAIALGSDGGGSIRGPASCCGLVGLKPARGRVSYAPGGDRQNGIATNGPLARTVADAAALLDVISGYVVGDPYWLPDPAQPFWVTAQQGKQQSSTPLKIAFSTAIAPIGDADPACQKAVLDTAHRLEELGHAVEPNCPDCNGLVEPFTIIWRSGVGASGLPPAALGRFNRWLLEQQDTSGTYLQAVWMMQMIARRIVAFFEQYDLLMLPVYLHPTIRVGEWTDLSPEETMQRIIHWIAPCPPFNATGQPAIALPAGVDANGVPIGIQLIGRPADEATLIALAAQLELMAPWHQQRPAIAEIATNSL